MYERVSQTFESLRRALGPGLSAKVTGDLAAFETYITEAFSNLDVQARAAAEANARAVDITERLSVLAKQLRTQNRQLKKQNRAIDAARTELELQSRAIAEATVDAVLEAEASQERVSELEQKRAELERTSVELEQKAKELEEEAAALANANADAVVLVLEKESSLEQMASTAQRAEEERDALQERVFVDELTGLFNYRYFREQIKFEYARAGRYGRTLSLIFLDLDRFKQVNDTYGHVAGDSVLREVAELVQSQLRTSDIPVLVGHEPVPIRYGGEEFVVILPETDLKGAVSVAERIRIWAEVHRHAVPGLDEPITVTLSAGVACMGLQDSEPWDMVRRADEALYRAKSAGRNRIEAAS